VKFIVDNQLPAALARFLVTRGIDCQHVLDMGLENASDREIWRYACAEDCIVISKDEDFLYLASLPAAGARLIWVRTGNCRRIDLLAIVERVWPRIENALKAGERVIELR
jgi:predicted nuclease of predicted toxin-antitoxin system